VRCERFAAARSLHAQLGVASQIASVGAEYRAALAAAEEDEDLLSGAMELGKKLKALKAAATKKPEEKWMRELTAEEAAQEELPLSYAQMRSSLGRLGGEWEAAFVSLYPTPFAEMVSSAPEDLDKALQAQLDAWTFVREMLGPVAGVSAKGTAAAAEESKRAVEVLRARAAAVLRYTLEQLSSAETFVRSASSLDLDAAAADSSRAAALSALLSAPDSRVRSCLTGAAVLYRIVLRVEFALALFGLAAPPASPHGDGDDDGDDALRDSCAQVHALWLALAKHCLSPPLQPIIADWFDGVQGTVDAQRTREELQETCGPEQIASRKGRQACALCLCPTANQEQGGMHADCAALHAKLFPEHS